MVTSHMWLTSKLWSKLYIDSIPLHFWLCQEIWCSYLTDVLGITCHTQLKVSIKEFGGIEELEEA